VCFTARELTKTGVTCAIFNRTHEDKTVMGVRTRPLDALAQKCANSEISAFIICGRSAPDMVRFIRANTRAPLIAWMHESQFDSGLVTALPAFDGVSYVSALINFMHSRIGSKPSSAMP
jgi:hypothetical protein